MKTLLSEKKNKFILVLFVLINASLGGLAYLSAISAADAKEVSLKTAIPFIALFCLIGGIGGAIVFYLAGSLSKKEIVKKEEKKSTPLVLILSFLLILLSWIPYFLAYYPGIVSYDSYIQVGQITSGMYNEHHPLIHTLTIKAMYDFGCRVLKNPNAGMAMYVILQAAFLAFSFSVLLSIIDGRLGRKFYIACLAFLMIYPYNGYLSISVTKDIPFSAFMLLSLSFMYLIMSHKKDGKVQKILLYCFLFVSLLGSVLYRNNGKYALLFMIGIMVICVLINIVRHFMKKSRFDGEMFCLTGVAAGALLMGILILTATAKILNAQQGDRREMLSVPIQQFARTYVYHAGVGVKESDDNTMDEESKALISEFILYDAATLYRADISDPVKRNVNTWVVVNRTEDFAKTYFRLLKNYPFDFVKAFSGTNAGYFNPFDKTHMHINEVMTEEGIRPGGAYVQTGWSEESLPEAGIVKASVIPGLYNFFESLANSNILNKIPVINLLFVPGVYIFIFANVVLTLLLQKKYKFLIPLCMTFGYCITLVMGPTVQLRYIYPVMISVPLMAVFCMAKKEIKVEK